MCDCEPDEVAEINREGQLREGQGGFERPVFAGSPGLRFTFDPVLGRSREIGFVVKERFQHGPGVVERETDAEREQTGQEKNFFHPGARMQLALRANVKYRHRYRGGEEDGDVD